MVTVKGSCPTTLKIAPTHKHTPRNERHHRGEARTKLEPIHVCSRAKERKREKVMCDEEEAEEGRREGRRKDKYIYANTPKRKAGGEGQTIYRSNPMRKKRKRMNLKNRME